MKASRLATFVSTVVLAAGMSAFSAPSASAAAATTDHVAAGSSPSQQSIVMAATGWTCGKAERFKAHGAYQCKRYVRFDYCGSGRPITLNQKTKMYGLMYNKFGSKPPKYGTDVDLMHAWKAVSKARVRTMRIGQKSGWVYVQTQKKPVASPYIGCGAP